MSYGPRNYLDDPADAPVWRYMNLEKLLSNQTSAKLHKQ